MYVYTVQVPRQFKPPCLGRTHIFILGIYLCIVETLQIVPRNLCLFDIKCDIENRVRMVGKVAGGSEGGREKGLYTVLPQYLSIFTVQHLLYLPYLLYVAVRPHPAEYLPYLLVHCTCLICRYVHTHLRLRHFAHAYLGFCFILLLPIYLLSKVGMPLSFLPPPPPPPPWAPFNLYHVYV